jgi:hypothetical protein
MDAIHTAALAAVAELGEAWHGAAKTLQATKLVRDRTGADLRTAVEAVKWAIERPPAESLPFGTIIAGTFAAAWVKEEESSVAERPWTATHIPGAISDVEVDEVLREGKATILRVGVAA